MTVLHIMQTCDSDVPVLVAATHVLSLYLDAKGTLGAAKLSKVPGLLRYLVRAVFGHLGDEDLRRRFLDVLFRVRNVRMQLSAEILELLEHEERATLALLREGASLSDASSRRRFASRRSSRRWSDASLLREPPAPQEPAPGPSDGAEPAAEEVPPEVEESPADRDARLAREEEERRPGLQVWEFPHDVSMLGSVLRLDRFLRNRGGPTEKRLDIKEVGLAVQRHAGCAKIALAALEGMMEGPSPEDFRVIGALPGFSDTIQEVLDRHPGTKIAQLMMELVTGVLQTGAEDAADPDRMPHLAPEALEQALQEQDAKLGSYAAACTVAMQVWLSEVPQWTVNASHGSRRYHVFGEASDVNQELVDVQREARMSWSPSHWSMWGAVLCAIDAVMETTGGCKRLGDAGVLQRFEEEWDKVVKMDEEEHGKLMVRRFQEDTEAIIQDLHDALAASQPTSTQCSPQYSTAPPLTWSPLASP